KATQPQLSIPSPYTWSKSIDDATAGSSNTAYPTEGTSSQLWGTKADRGLSALNHQLRRQRDLVSSLSIRTQGCFFYSGRLVGHGNIYGGHRDAFHTHSERIECE